MAITLINTAVIGSQPSVTSLALPATSLTLGNTIAVAVRWATSGSVTVTGVADTAGNTYTANTAVISGDSVQWFYCLNAIGNASNIVTVTLSGAAGFVYIASLQYSGLAAKDTTASALTAGTSITSSAFTTTSPNELILVAAQVAHVGDTWTAGSGYTIEANADGADRVLMVEDQIVSTIQTGVTASASSPTSTTRIMSVITFVASLTGSNRNSISNIIGI